MTDSACPSDFPSGRRHPCQRFQEVPVLPSIQRAGFDDVDREGSHRSPTARRFGRRRRGVAAVEFAVCLPVIVLLVFGSIEASSYIFLKQSLNVAAYEGIREAVRLTSDNAAARATAETILNARSVNDFQIRFPNGESSSLNRGDNVVIEVSAPTATNSPLVGQFIPNRILNARVVMVKE